LLNIKVRPAVFDKVLIFLLQIIIIVLVIIDCILVVFELLVDLKVIIFEEGSVVPGIFHGFSIAILSVFMIEIILKVCSFQIKS